MKKIVGFLAVLLMASSCVRDNVGDNGKNGPQGETEVVLRLRTPSNGISSTRSLSETQQEDISSIHVLVFDDDDNYATSVLGEVAADKKSFSVALQSGVEQKLLILANVTDAMIISAGIDEDTDDYDAIQAKLKIAVSDRLIMGISERIPMVGLIESITPEAGMAAPTVLLTRSLAKVEVGIGEYNATNPAEKFWTKLDTEGNPIPFEITSIHLVRPNDNYMLVPSTVPLSSDVDPEVTTPTLSDDENSPMEVEDAFAYSLTDSVGTIFVPEFDMDGMVHDEQTAIVIGGKYNGNTVETFYRVNFAPGGSLSDILRNHSYRIDIMSVGGDGQVDVPTAYAAGAVNMDVNVSEWEEEPMDVYFSGDKFLGITPDGNPTFNPYGNETQIIAFETNATDFKVTIPGATEDEDLVVGTLSASDYFSYLLTNPSDGKYSLAIMTLAHNIGGAAAKTEEITLSFAYKNIPLTSTQTAEAAFTPTAPAAPAAIDAPYLLYYDKATRKLAVGRWADKVNKENILYTKFGSLVAFSNGTGLNGDEFDASDVMFNPTTTTYNAANWASIPRLSDADLTGDPNAENYITANHNQTNVGDGIGDICKLVGLTEAQAKNMLANGTLDAYDSGYRLPTIDENIDFVGAPTDWYETSTAQTMSETNVNFVGSMGTQAGGWFPILGDRESTTRTEPLNNNPAGFLPSLGVRGNTDGKLAGTNTDAYYWSASVSGTNGRYLGFNNNVGPANITARSNAYNIRCVPSGTGQTSTNTILATAKTEGGYVDADGDVSVETVPDSDNPFRALVLAYDGSTKYTEGTMLFAGTKTAYSPSYTFKEYAYYPVFPARMVYPSTNALTLYGLAPVVNELATNPGAAKIWDTSSSNPSAEITGREDLMAAHEINAELEFSHLLTKLNVYVTALTSDISSDVGTVKSIRLVGDQSGTGVLNTKVTFTLSTGLTAYSANGTKELDFWTNNNTKFNGANLTIPTSTTDPWAYTNAAPVTSNGDEIDYYFHIVYGKGTSGQNTTKVVGLDLKKIDGTTSFTGSTVGRAFDVEIKFEESSVPDDAEITILGMEANGFGYQGWKDGGDDITIPLPLPKPPVYTADNAPYILYVNARDRLSLGQWGTQVSQQNILYTQFGSLVAFTGVGDGGNLSDTFDETDVKFNPTSNTYNAANWSSIPRVPDTTFGEVENYVTANHTAANVNAGIGDICRLAGITGDQARVLAKAGQLHEYNSGYRLPTAAENESFTGITGDNDPYTAHWDVTGIGGIAGGYFPTVASNPGPVKFLPAAGHRNNTTAVLTSFGNDAYYWSSSVSAVSGYRLYFNGSRVFPNDMSERSYAFPVRCVRN